MKTVTKKTIIQASPEKIWNFITGLHQNDNYKKWHPKDHLIFSLKRGNMGKIGGVAYFEERIGRFTLKMSYTATKTIYPSYLEYRAAPPLSWLRAGRGSFTMEPLNPQTTHFVAYVEYGYKTPLVSGVLDWIIGKIISYEDICKHIHEEGQNLKIILENRN